MWKTRNEKNDANLFGQLYTSAERYYPISMSSEEFRSSGAATSEES